MNTRFRSTAVVGGALALGLALSGGLVAYASDTPASSPSASEKAAAALDKSIPRPTERPAATEKLDIGPWQPNKPAPDLVPGQTDDGKPGFLLTYDLANANPDEQETRRVDDKTIEIVLPVYAEDGVTKIGDFTAGTITEE